MNQRALQKHSLVVGGGIGGISIALLLAEAGRKVTLIEERPKIGGLLQRFSRGGVPFDTGFHFTGGFDEILSQMLTVLNMADAVRETPFATRIYLGSSHRRIVFPTTGIDDVIEYLCGEYPHDRDRIAAYYRAEKEVIAATPMMNLTDRTPPAKMLMNDYDFITMDAFLDSLGIRGELRGVLCSAAMCHGTPPCESSVTHHARVSYGLAHHIAQVDGGGDAFISGFLREAKRLGITILTSNKIAECLDYRKRECRRVRLADGSELEFDDAFLSIHPEAIMELMPPESIKPIFRSRVENAQDSCGFFTIFGELDESLLQQQPELTSYLSEPDLNNILLPGRGAYGTGMVISQETGPRGPVKTLNAFSSVFPEETECWRAMPDRHRCAAYQEYKLQKQQQVFEDVCTVYPHFRDKVKIRASASMLTFRDYAPPRGCGYGVRQRVEEPRFWGRLPIWNFYALGHNALIPGILGTMMSSFLLFRLLMGEEVYNDLINRRLGGGL